MRRGGDQWTKRLLFLRLFMLGSVIMNITIADDIVQATGLSPDELLQELAITLFQQQRLTLEGASRLAGMDQCSFQHLLANRQIPIHYGSDDLVADVATLKQIGQR